MTGMFVCVVEPRLDCRAKGPRHAVIRIMGSWSQRKDNQTCVPAYFCAQARAGTAVRVWIRLASATAKSHDNLKLSSQTFIDVCRSSCFAAHLSDISQCVHLFCINFCQDWKKLSTRPSKHTHTSWFPLERISLLWAWHLRRWLYKPLVNALWFPNAE